MASVKANLNNKLARMRGVRAEVRAVAAEVLAEAKARALAHRDRGDLARSLKLERGRIDVQIVSNDAQILAKEYGHLDPHTGRHVPGVHALGGAAADVAARRRTR